MNRLSRLRSLMTLIIFLIFAVAMTISSGLTSEEKTYNPPKLWDGTTPDFRGIWEARGTAYRDIEGHAAQNGQAAAKSLIVDPPDGKIPYKPEARAVRDTNYQNRLTADPESKCYESGVPRVTYLPKPLQIVQSPGNFALIYEDNHAFRIVYPQSFPHFEGIDWWLGDSRGHWEGNTYVVDVISLNADAWFDAAGNHHSDNMHVVERYTPTGPDTIQYEARIEDPDTFTRPWTIRTVLYRQKQPGVRIIEDECLDDENGVRRHISPTDPLNVQHNDFSRWKNSPVNMPAAPEPAPTAPLKPAADLPRLPNGHPDLNGLWFKMGGGFPAGAGAAAGPGAARGASTATGTGAGAGARGGAGGRGRGAGGPGPGSDASTDFARIGVPRVPYTPEAFQEMEWRGEHAYLDGEPRCHLAGVPRSAQQPPYPHQIIQDDKYFTIMYEYVHEPRIIPLDGSAHPKNYTGWDGDSRGHWEGDALVVDVTNFNGRDWLDMSGNFVDENEHAVERYTMLDADTMNYEVTITDPTVFTRPWTMRFLVKRQPATDQILEYGCLEGEQDRQHYTEEYGGKNTILVKDGELQASLVESKATATAGPEPADTVAGCLRISPDGIPNTYTLDTQTNGSVRLTTDPGLKSIMQTVLDRDVRFRGKWESKSQRQFGVQTVSVLAEGCTVNTK